MFLRSFSDEGIPTFYHYYHSPENMWIVMLQMIQYLSANLFHAFSTNLIDLILFSPIDWHRTDM